MSPHSDTARTLMCRFIPRTPAPTPDCPPSSYYSPVSLSVSVRLNLNCSKSSKASPQAEPGSLHWPTFLCPPLAPTVRHPDCASICFTPRVQLLVCALALVWIVYYVYVYASVFANVSVYVYLLALVCIRIGTCTCMCVYVCFLAQVFTMCI